MTTVYSLLKALAGVRKFSHLIFELMAQVLALLQSLVGGGQLSDFIFELDSLLELVFDDFLAGIDVALTSPR